MSRAKNSKRRLLVAGGGAVAAVLAAAGFGLLHPVVGPIMGTLAPQAYVDTISEGDIPQRGPFVLVDAASARLYMLRDGKVQDTMKVIVGKPGSETPAFDSVMHYATLNPYWYVPTDLAKKIIAPRVVADGEVYLTDRGYEVIDRLATDARVLPWNSVDWKGVADGSKTVLVRQKPGPYNSMGHLKFSLARNDGIYMHDTPHKELFDKPERSLSNGCVRLQDADRLARWMIGDSPKLATTTPDSHVALPRPVPVKVAYLDANAQLRVAGLQ